MCRLYKCHNISSRVLALTSYSVTCFVTALSLFCHCSVTALSLFNGHFTASQSGQRGLSSSESCQPEVSQLGGALTHHIQQLSSGLLEERGGEGRGGEGRGREGRREKRGGEGREAERGTTKGSIVYQFMCGIQTCRYVRMYVYM